MRRSRSQPLPSPTVLMLPARSTQTIRRPTPTGWQRQVPCVLLEQVVGNSASSGGYGQTVRLELLAGGFAQVAADRPNARPHRPEVNAQTDDLAEPTRDDEPSKRTRI